MSLMEEYINKRLSIPELEKELQRLIGEYNELRETYLFVYAAASEKQIPATILIQSDFFTIRDILSDKKSLNKIDMYIETRGGSGETAEEIVKFLHNNFNHVSFVVSGEAKSAGTILVLSGDDILMTESGSLGPIDAQIKIGRSTISAYDYIEWVEEKRKEAEELEKLNPFDATMIAQITPGELKNVSHALNFAKDLVIEWLPKYKFKNWTETETRKIPVTDDLKIKRAEEIADNLTDHSKWRSHGRSIKINDLIDDIKLKIVRIDDNEDLAKIVYSIQTVCRMIFDQTTTFKIFSTHDNKIFRLGTPVGKPIKLPIKQKVEVAEIEQKCPKCNTSYKIYAKFDKNPKIDVDFKKKGSIPFPKDGKIVCKCGFEIDLLGAKNQLEMQVGEKIIIN